MRQGGLNLQGRRWALLLRSGARCGDWGSLRGLGCIAGAVDVVEVVVGGEGEVLSTGPGACVICMLPWALVQQNSCQAGVVHICAESGGGRPSSQSTSASDRAPVGEGEAVAVGLVEDDGEEVQGLVS